MKNLSHYFSYPRFKTSPLYTNTHNTNKQYDYFIGKKQYRNPQGQIINVKLFKRRRYDDADTDCQKSLYVVNNISTNAIFAER